MGEAAIYEFSSRQQQTSCCVCGIAFCMPESMLNARRRDGELFYCPNGHNLSFSGAIKRESDNLKAELERTKQALEIQRQAKVRAEVRADHEERRARAARGQVTKIRNRVGNGVCPCCNRTFQNLQRHMHNQHPEFARDECTAGLASTERGE